jgi:transmembrane sensor
MSQDDFDILLKKYLEGNCSPAEESKILKWYENLIRESRLELTYEEKLVIESKIWAKVHSGLNHNTIKIGKAPVLRSNSKTIYRIAVAACIVLLLGSGWYWFSGSHSSSSKMYEEMAVNKIPPNFLRITNEDGIDKKVPLSDGSVVILHPGGSLYYPTSFAGSKREVYLTGNAFFKVFHNPAKHFIVHTGGLLTEVLGTSFNITHDAKTNKIEVAVVTGRVSVYEQSKIDEVTTDLQPNSVILSPNQKVTYNSSNNQFITSLVEDPKPLVNIEKAIDSSDRFIFDETPLSSVLNEIAKVYGIDINTETKNINDCHFTGDISRQDLYKKLDIICQSTRSSYEVKGTEILIKGKGCN